MSQFDAIPDELKERDQWLMWDSSADKYSGNAEGSG